MQEFICSYCFIWLLTVEGPVVLQSIDDIEQHMLALHSGDSMTEVSANQVVVALAEGQADSMINTEPDYIVPEVGQGGLYGSQSEEFAQPASQSEDPYLVSETRQVVVEQLVSSECPSVVNSHPEETLAYQVLP